MCFSSLGVHLAFQLFIIYVKVKFVIYTTITSTSTTITNIRTTITIMQNLIVSCSSSIKFVSDQHCRTVVVRAAKIYHDNCIIRFFSDADDEKPVRTETNTLALLSHEVSVTVLHNITCTSFCETRTGPT